MVVLVICKNEEHTITNEGARVSQSITHQYLRCSRADNSGVSGGIWPKFEIIQAFMHALVTCKNENVTCKNENDSIKNEGARVVTTFFPL